ncbi:MAG TPA: gamma-glutamyl-gamma-aminobutyrate hydrolase family protein [Chthonomonadaceae bacterium]|nr:gamma-glutamyl-gamma-aminobutyrate hydrolase family protein [Chthonomonadaceae bacterium]
MPRKIVGITCSTLPGAEGSGPRQMLNRSYAWAVEQAGGVPLILPVTTDTEAASRYLSVLDGLLLSGGVDVGPERYGQTPHPELGEVDTDRDITEWTLLQAALAQDMPIFGICRGIQMLNVALGGTLYQDLPSERPGPIHHQQRQQNIPRNQATHSIEVHEDTRLASLVGAGEMRTNSFHHQALRDVASPLVVTALAPDGVIEGVESLRHRYLVAVQFHPEDTAPVDEKSRRLFRGFVAAL